MASTTVDGKSIAEGYLRRLEIGSQEVVYRIRKNGKYESITWAEAHGRVLGIFQSHKKHNIQAGDRVCIISQSRPEWSMVDLANLCCGVISVPIYQSNIAEDAAFILDHCGAKLVFAEDASQVQKLKEAFATLKKEIPVIVFDPRNPVPGISVTPFEEYAKPTSDKALEEEFKSLALKVEPNSVASIVYTSGTTGRPKGAVLTHANFLGEIRPIVQNFHITHEDCTLTFLPFAHILGRVESLMPVFSGLVLGFADNINSIPQDIVEVKPTFLVSVPRIYEKVFAKVQSEVASQPAFKQNIFRWASEIGREVARRRSEHKRIPLSLAAKMKIADQLVLHKIREKLGGRIRIAVSGGAPLSADLCEFFHACGVPIIEGYGLTETTAAVTVNRPEDFAFGTVGKPLGDIEVRIAGDGEIQLRGAMVFKEYFRDPEATKEVFTEDHWFCTGDIGEITPRGNLKITDRKKELIVTSGGKNIAPQKLENMLKGIRYVSHSLVYGDKQKYIAALITLNEPEAKKWADQNGVSYRSYEELTLNPKLNAMIEDEIKGVNHHLPSFESIKRFTILPNDFTIETGELTPSLKVKRKVCAQKYKTYIDQMFS